MRGKRRIDRHQRSPGRLRDHLVKTRALEGFASAKVLLEALRRAGPKPTRAKVLAALESLRGYDLGGLEISYSPQDHSGIDFADLAIISDGRFKR